MSTIDTAGKRSATIIPEAYELADQIDAIRTDLQSLRSTIGRTANKQVRQNPFYSVAIAAGLGFLFGLFSRR
jgi:ElaB/YqjD/DUF883 family membrane-anchored ribosome-binding protein